MENVKIYRCTLLASFAVGSILGGVSLPTLTVISVDRLLALLLRLKYRQVVTLRRTKVLLFSLWVVAAVCSAMNVLSYNVALQVTNIAVSLYLITSISSYTWIFFALRHRQSQVQNAFQQGQPSRATPLNIARYKKAVSSALWVQLVHANCLLPPLWDSSGLVGLHWTSISHFSSGTMHNHTGVFKFLLKPSHLLKIKELREVVKLTIREFFSSWRVFVESTFQIFF